MTLNYYESSKDYKLKYLRNGLMFNSITFTTRCLKNNSSKSFQLNPFHKIELIRMKHLKKDFRATVQAKKNPASARALGLVVVKKLFPVHKILHSRIATHLKTHQTANHYSVISFIFPSLTRSSVISQCQLLILWKLWKDNSELLLWAWADKGCWIGTQQQFFTKRRKVFPEKCKQSKVARIFRCANKIMWKGKC